MKQAIVHSAGKPHEVIAVKVIAFYHPETGDIAHMHTVITFKGAKPTREEEAIMQARRLADQAGIQTAHLHTKISTNREHTLGPHRIDLASGEFVPIHPPPQKR